MARNNGNDISGWVGWVYFAGFLMVVMGILQAIAGLTALLRNTYFLVGKSSLVVFNYTTWGWIHLILGIVILMAGTAVINGRFWGRLVAIFLAMISLIANFVFIAAYPWWSIIAIVIDVLIIYALTVHGNETEV